VKKRKRVFRHQVVIELYTEIGRNELNQPIRDWVAIRHCVGGN